MSIPPRFLDELRDRLTLSEVVGRRIKLTRAGREFKGCCPFHQEKSPSFYINDDKQFYHCFGCGAHGDVVGFAMQHDNLSFIEAVESLAGEAGMQVPRQSPQAVAQARKEKSLHSLIDDACRFFEAELMQARGRDALGYLKERGVPDALIAAFRLGYAPADGETLFRHLKDKGYETDQMVEAGLVRRSERGREPYSFFRDRLMFPVADRRGRVVAFGGRVLPEHLRPVQGDAKPPKYINSSDTPLFHKGQMLYGEAHARQTAADGEAIIVVEGYLDVMACFGAGWRGAVAPLGTALTDDQILSLWKMIVSDEKCPILCFDGDAAGQRAAARACARLLPLLKPGHSARFAFLPEGEDPDSLIRHQGKKAFAAVIDGAMSLIDFLWHSHTGGRSYDTPESRAGLSHALEADIAQIPDRTVQQFYRQMLKERVYQSFAAARSSRFPGKKSEKPPSPPIPGIRRPARSAEVVSGFILLAALLNHPHIFDAVEDDCAGLIYADSRFSLLHREIMAQLAHEPALDSEALQSHLKRKGFAPELDHVLHQGIYTHASFARPGAPPEKILAGWRDTLRFMHKRTVWNEVRQAGRELATDFTEENEQRLLGIRRDHEDA